MSRSGFILFGQNKSLAESLASYFHSQGRVAQAATDLDSAFSIHRFYRQQGLETVALISAHMRNGLGLRFGAEVFYRQFPITLAYACSEPSSALVSTLIKFDVRGLISLDTGVEELLASLNLVSQGRPVVSPALGRWATIRGSRLEFCGKSRLDPLTSKNLRALVAIAKHGLQGAARVLFASDRTIEGHKRAIKQKLCLASSSDHELLKLAITEGLLDDDRLGDQMLDCG